MTNKMNFLQEVSNSILLTYGNKLNDLCIVTPSNRGGLHLKQCFHSQIGKTFLTPDIFSIEEFIQKIAGLTLISPEELLIRLYKLNQELKLMYHQNFYNFVNDAKTILQDFNDIDLSLANPQDVFSDLSRIKELSYFGKNESELSENQTNYLKFYQNIFPLYQQLKNELLENKLAYQGLLYRCVYENKEDIIKYFTYKKIIFVGFNALQNVEIEIINYLLEKNLADIYVDADEWYLNDTLQEAGMFLRKMKDDFHLKDLKIVGKYIENINKKIQIIGFPQNDLQPFYVEKILKELPNNKEEKTALVLADENLLLPLLYAIDTSEANISMGLSIRNSQIYHIINHFITTIENIQKYNNTIHYQDLYVFFSSPYIQNVLTLSNLDNDLIIDNLLQKGKLFYTIDDIKKINEHFPVDFIEVLTNLFQKSTEPESIINNLRAFLTLINNDKLLEIDKQIISLIYHHLDKLLLLFKQIDKHIKSYSALLDLYISSLTLSFKSNPMSSLQIIGMLETRILDFDNVIILSVNEDILPMGKSIKSFIPYDVKKHYKLPTYTHREAIFSYHFYRLLQRSKNIYLLYNTNNQNEKAEKSRFINQIQNEWNKIPSIDISEKILSYPQIKIPNNKPITIAKTPFIVEQLQNLRKYSPSMLNRYLECSLKFYFNDVLQLSEPQMISDDLQANVIGNVIHKILEELLKEGKYISKDIKNDNLEKKVLHAFLDKNLINIELDEKNILYEKNRLIYAITIKYIKDYLFFLKEQLEKREIIEIKDFEKKYEIKYEISNQFINKNIYLKGVIDRVDNRSDSITTIVDYKTGRVDSKTLFISKVEDVFSGNNSIAFQLMFYAFLYNCATKQTPIKAQIVYFRTLKEDMTIKIANSPLLDQPIFDDFKILLDKLIEDIHNNCIPFSQTENKDRCKYCAYQTICKRN